MGRNGSVSLSQHSLTRLSNSVNKFVSATIYGNRFQNVDQFDLGDWVIEMVPFFQFFLSSSNYILCKVSVGF